MAYKDLKGNLFPEPGERLKHKMLRVEGIYVQEVTVNRGRRHLKVVSDDGKVYILPASDWQLAEGKTSAP